MDDKKEIIEEIGLGNVINSEKAVVEAGVVEEEQEDQKTINKQEDKGFNKNFIKKFF